MGGTELTASKIAALVRSTIAPVLRERGFESVGTTWSFRHPHDDVVHRFHLERFSNYHREVMGFPKFTMSAHVTTYFPAQLFVGLNDARPTLKDRAKWTNKKGQVEIRENLAMPGRREALLKTVEQPDGVPNGDVRLRHENWLMLEATVDYCQMLLDDIAVRLAEAFDHFHAPLADVEGTLAGLLADPPQAEFLGPRVVSTYSGNRIESTTAQEIDRISTIVSCAVTLGDLDLAAEYAGRLRALQEEWRAEQDAALAALRRSKDVLST
ncbi:MAG: hypothetical protein AAF567_03550 [Actinomycetota bacterium]